jgi:hypothetical protein
LDRPIFAELVGLFVKCIRFANPVLYQNAENGFNDITQGNNGSYSAVAGWDPCTGLGSPDGNPLSLIFAAKRDRRCASGTRGFNPQRARSDRRLVTCIFVDHNSRSPGFDFEAWVLPAHLTGNPSSS